MTVLQFAQRQPFLGAYMIVRNGEDTIGALIPALQNFDELVIVDTGSTDKTLDLVRDLKPHGVRLVIDKFDWIDDFAAARNYAFSLGSATWRAYIDADDQWPTAKHLKSALQEVQKNDVEVNCLAVPYDYAPQYMQPLTPRVVRWADGWHWKGILHEQLAPLPACKMRVVVANDFVVQHRPALAHWKASADRNERLFEKALVDPNVPADEKAMLKFHAACHYWQEYGDAAKAARLFEECALDPSLIGHDDGLTRGKAMCAGAAAQRGFIALSANDNVGAVKWGERSVSIVQGSTGYFVIGIGLTRMGQSAEACRVFDYAFSLPSTADVAQDALACAFAAVAYLAAGRRGDADTAIARIPEALRTSPEVAKVLAVYQKRLDKAKEAT